MRFIRGSQCVVWGSLAALLYGGPANPGRGVTAAIVAPDRPAALAEEGFSLASQEQKTALAEAGTAVPLQDMRAAIAEPSTRAAPAVPDQMAAPADPGVTTISAGADVVAASSDRSLKVTLGERDMVTVPVEPNAKPKSAELVAKLAAVDPDAKTISVRSSGECLLINDCVDQYLWSLYERTPKLDTVKSEERVSISVKKKGKQGNVTRTVTKFMDENFTWKDPHAAQKVGMSTMDYVVGGMDHDFKLRLYRLLRALDDAELEPGITSAFRDDYRQSIAAGKKAASDNSYHGGSRHGGYGHGLAADLVSVKGETRTDRQVSSDELWKWIDAHGKEFGIGRPYLDKDPPHVGPIDGKEYASHRGVNAKHAENHVNAVNAKHADNHSTTKRGNNQANARRVDGVNAKDADSVNAKPVDKSSLRAGANARRVNTVNAKGADRVNTKPADKSSPRARAAL